MTSASHPFALSLSKGFDRLSLNDKVSCIKKHQQ